MAIKQKTKLCLLFILILNYGCSSSNKKWYSNKYASNEIKQILYKCNHDAQLATNNSFSGSNKRWALIGAVISANKENSLFDECVDAYGLSTTPPLQLKASSTQIQNRKNSQILDTHNLSEYKQLIIGTWSEVTVDTYDKTTFFPNNTFSEIVKIVLPDGNVKRMLFGGNWLIKESLLSLEITSTTLPEFIPKGFKFSMEIVSLNNKELHLKDFMQNKITISYKVNAN